MARAGVASRRDVERYIAEGRVSLNGQVLESPAVKVGPGDVLLVDGKVIEDAEPTRLWRYHKPVGLVTSHKDPFERPTVFSHLPPELPRVISVGRLDLNSEGLLLLTNDGGLARALELPSSGWVRRYRARARGRITQEKLDRLKDGITIEGVNYGSIDAKLDKAKEGPQGANLWITVGLTEGKNREVRRVLEHLGLTVNRLIRLAYGPFSLGTLEVGEVEEVGPRVIRELLSEYIAPASLPTGDRAPRPPSRAAVASPSRRGASASRRTAVEEPDAPSAGERAPRGGFGQGGRKAPEPVQKFGMRSGRRSPPGVTDIEDKPGKIPRGGRPGFGKTPRAAADVGERGRGPARAPARPAAPAAGAKRAFGKPAAKAASEADAKLEYKPGWAKPKPKRVIKPKPGGSRPRPAKAAAPKSPRPPRKG